MYENNRDKNPREDPALRRDRGYPAPEESLLDDGLRSTVSRAYAQNEQDDEGYPADGRPPSERLFGEEPDQDPLAGKSEKRPLRGKPSAKTPSLPLSMSGVGLVAAGLSVVALGMAGTGVWLSYRQGQTQEQLQTELQRQANMIARPARDPAMEQIVAEMHGLENQVDDLRGVLAEIQQPAQDPGQSAAEENRQRLALLSQKVSTLETALDGLHKRVESLPRGTARAASAPQVAGGSGGKWVISLASLSNQALADKELRRLRKLRIDAAIRKARVGGKTWYRLVVPGFSSRQAAQQRSGEIRKKAGLRQVWVKKEGT